MKRWQVVIGIVVLALTAGVAVLMWVTRSQPPDEQQLYNLVAEAQQAANSHNAGGLIKLVSDDYMDQYGNDKHKLTPLILGWMRSMEQYRVVAEVNRLEIIDNTARLRLKVTLFTGQEQAGRGQEFPVEVQLRKEGRHWKAISAVGYGEAASGAMDGE